jgi:hypothetical protein
LHEAVAYAVALDDDRLARVFAVYARARVRHAQFIEAFQRRPDRRRAVVHVVGVADGVHAGNRQGLRRAVGRVEPFVLDRSFLCRLIEAAFQIGKHDIRCLQPFRRLRERDGGVFDAHQVDIAG